MLVSPCTLFRLFPAPLAGCAPGIKFLLLDLPLYLHQPRSRPSVLAGASLISDTEQSPGRNDGSILLFLSSGLLFGRSFFARPATRLRRERLDL